MLTKGEMMEGTIKDALGRTLIIRSESRVVKVAILDREGIKKVHVSLDVSSALALSQLIKLAAADAKPKIRK